MPRRSVLDRYVLRECALDTLAVVIALLVMFTGVMFAEVVEQVADGRMASGALLAVLALHLVSTLQTTLPLGMFLGVLLALGRMYRDNEMAVLAASGFGPRGLIRPVAIIGVTVAVAVAAVSLWLGPLAVRASHRKIAQANRSVIAPGLAPGRFTRLAGGGILLADSVSPDGTRLGRLFVARERAGRHGVPHLSIVTAAHAELVRGGPGDAPSVVLHEGHRYDIPLGRDDWRIMRFQRSGLALARPSADPGDRPDNQRSTTSLMADPDPAARAELQWRIAVPAGTLALAMLALPLARQRPRASPAGRVLAGVLAYLTMMNLAVLTRMHIANGTLDAGIGMWWISVPVLVAAAWAFARQNAIRRRPGAPASAR